MRQFRVSAWLSVVLLMAMPAVSAFALESGVRSTSNGPDGHAIEAELDGAPFELARINEHHCHDAAYPIIRCFRDEADRDADIDLDLRTATLDVRVAGPAFAPAAPCSTCTYVTLYWDINQGGSSISFVYDHANLGIYGWNDQASSYLARNCGQPKLYWDADFSGNAIYTSACNGLNFTGVHGAWNDQVSSIANLN
jgi:hypothetical protein